MTDEPRKTCLDCPSYVPPQETGKYVGQQFGGAFCATRGLILSRPGLKSAGAIAENLAKNCSEYGKEPPEKPNLNHRYNLQIALPILPPPAVRRNKVNTCTECRFYVQSDQVVDTLGWNSGGCVLKGKLIPDSSRAAIGVSCDESSKGARYVPYNYEWNLMPIFMEDFGKLDPISEYLAGRGGVNPENHPTDRPVSDVDRNRGIKAWYEVKDMDGSGHSVFLPVYDTSRFSDEDRAKVPRTGDDEHPELYVNHGNFVYKVAVSWVGLGETPALWGSAGLGKTELLRHMAWRMCLPFERISITGSSEVDDLAGKMHFSPDTGTYWEHGRIPKAWMKACVLCIDEPNVGPPEVWQLLRPLTDNSKQLVLDQNRGERIPKNQDCYLGMAMNPAWDPRNRGAEPLADADGSRLLHVSMELPPPDVEKQIISDRVKLDGRELTANQLSTMMKVAEAVRAMSAAGTIPVTFGIRDQIKVARALGFFPPQVAYRVAIGDSLEPQARDALMVEVNNHWTDSSPTVRAPRRGRPPKARA